MPIAIYRQSVDTYQLIGNFFITEDVTHIFEETRKDRAKFKVNIHADEFLYCDAFHIAGLSGDDLKMLDAALLLSGEPKYKRAVIMLFVNVDPKYAELQTFQGLHAKPIMEAAKAAKQDAKNAVDIS